MQPTYQQTSRLMWPNEAYLTQLTEPDAAAAVLQLVVRIQEWVHRRVETVVFRDGETLTRRVSVDFTIPAQAPTVHLGADAIRVVPLAMMRKRSLVDFDLVDEGGASITHLGLRYNQAITRTVLRMWARECLGSEVAEAVDRDLDAIATGTQEELTSAYARMKSTSASCADQRQALMRSKPFRLVLELLHEYFLLLVGVEAAGPVRRVLKFRYSEERPSRETLGLWSRFASRIGWTPATYMLPTTAATDAHTFHLQVMAPEGVEVVEALLVAGSPTNKHARPHFDISGDSSMVDLHVAEVENGCETLARLRLRPQRRGWLTVSAAAAWITVLILAALAARSNGAVLAGRQGGDVAAVIVTLTGVLTALLVRPTEHPLVTSLLRYARMVSLSCSLIPFLAAAVLLMNLPPLGLMLSWIILTAAAWLSAVTLLISAIRAPRPKSLSGPWDQGEDAQGISPPPSFSQAIKQYKLTNGAVAVDRSPGGRFGWLGEERQDWQQQDQTDLRNRADALAARA